jgi:DNA-binding PadR family transcriptional regulator
LAHRIDTGYAVPRSSSSNLGEFEHRVLLAVLRLGGEAYSVSVVEELEASAGRSAAQAAVFMAMQRLEKRELLESRLEEPGEDGASHVRRYFRLTDAGLAELRETRRVLNRLWSGVEHRLEEG